MKSAAANIDATSGQLRQTLAEATGPDEQGLTAGANLRESLTNVDAATSNMADERSAEARLFLSRLLPSPRLLQFAKHLGGEISQRPPLHQSAKPRTWLPADQLFERESNGVDI